LIFANPLVDDMTPNETPIRDRQRWFKVALLSVLAVAVLGFATRNLIFGKPVETYEAVRSGLLQTIVASGNIITPGRESVGAEITGHVARIPVDEGQAVRQDQALIELDDKDERATVDQARAAVLQSEAKLRQLREVGLPAAEQGLKQAKANALQAHQQFERTKALQARGFIGQSQLDDAQRNLDVAESQLRAAQLQVETNRPTGSDYALAQTALDQAKSNLLVAQARLGHTVIRAPADGTLIARNVEVGDTVQPGKQLMALAPAGETQVVVQIDEKNLAQLAVGQKALGSADAFPGQRFTAELFYINPGIDPLRGSVAVKLKVPNPPAYLRQDMTVSVDIEVARRADAVVIPTDAVHDAAGAQPWVLVVRGHRAVRQAVKLGLHGDARVEVLEGVTPGDALIPATNGVATAGQRVRAIAAAKGGAR
jgi:HlyD family secretion protein